MLICLSCRFVSPAGSLRCGRCGRSFGGRLCPRHHLSPAGSQFCVQCGKQDLTDSTLFLPMGWLSRLLAWGIALLFISLISRHISGFARSLWGFATWLLIHLVGICPCVLVQGLAKVLTWFLALLLLSWFLPGTSGVRLRSVLLGMFYRTGRVVSRLARSFGSWLYQKVEGASAISEKTEKAKKKH